MIESHIFESVYSNGDVWGKPFTFIVNSKENLNEIGFILNKLSEGDEPIFKEKYKLVFRDIISGVRHKKIISMNEIITPSSNIIHKIVDTELPSSFGNIVEVKLYGELKRFCYNLNNFYGNKFLTNLIEIIDWGGYTFGEYNSITINKNVNLTEELPLFGNSPLGLFADWTNIEFIKKLLISNNIKSLKGMLSNGFSYSNIPYNNVYDLDLINSNIQWNNIINLEKCFENRLDINSTNFLTNRMTLVGSNKEVFKNCINMNFMPNFDTSNVTTLSGMFYGCSKFNQSLNFETKNVKSFSNMFTKCISLEKDITFTKTADNANLDSMFKDCSKFNNSLILDLSKVSILTKMFENCKSLTKILNFNNLPMATKMDFMYNGCSLLALDNVSLEINSLNVNTMNNMFENCVKLNFRMIFIKAPKLIDMSEMFKDCVTLNSSVNVLEVSPINLSGLFENCHNFTNVVNIDYTRTQNVSRMFKNCYNYANIIDLKENVNITDCSSMFENCYKYNHPFILNNVINLNKVNKVLYGTKIFDSMFYFPINNINEDYIIFEKPLPSKEIEDINSLYWDAFIDKNKNNISTTTGKILDEIVNISEYGNKLYKSIKNSGLELFANEPNVQLPFILDFNSVVGLTFPTNSFVWSQNNLSNIKVSLDSNNSFSPLLNSNNQTHTFLENERDNSKKIYVWGKFKEFTNRVIDEKNVINIDSGHVLRKNFKFTNCEKLVLIDLTKIVKSYTCYDTLSDCTDMFRGCKSLENIIGLNEIFEENEILRTGQMFLGCKELDMEINLDTKNVSAMNGMFNGCSKLNSKITLNTDNCTNLLNFFRECSLFNQPIPWLNTSKATTITSIFRGCVNLNQNINIDLSNMSDMSYAFYLCSKLDKEVTFTNSNTKLTNLAYTFASCVLYNHPINLITDNVTNMSYFLSQCKVYSYPINFETKNVTDFSYMFSGCESFNHPVKYNTSKGVNFMNMFSGCSIFNQEILFDTINSTDFSYMFSGCLVFNQTINFKSENVTNMRYMFGSNLILDSNISFTSFSKVTSMQGMFFRCRNFNKYVNFRNTSSLLVNVNSMFKDCLKFNQIVSLDTRNVTDFSDMFSGCNLYNQNTTFNTSNATLTTNMFKDCYSFNKPIKFDMRKVVNVNSMFYNCRVFNQPIQFETPELIDVNYILYGAYNFDNIIKIDLNNISSNISLFHSNKHIPSTANEDLNPLYWDSLLLQIKNGNYIPNFKILDTIIVSPIGYDIHTELINSGKNIFRNEVNIQIPTIYEMMTEPTNPINMEFRFNILSENGYIIGKMGDKIYKQGNEPYNETISSLSKLEIYGKIKNYSISSSNRCIYITKKNEYNSKSNFYERHIMGNVIRGKVELRYGRDIVEVDFRDYIKTSPWLEPIGTSLANFFEDCERLSKINNARYYFSGIEVSSTKAMFKNCFEFNQQLNTIQLNTINNEDMSEMFSGCKLFNQTIPYSINNVTNMTSLFENCINLEVLFDLNLDKVVYTNKMFKGCVKFNNGNMLFTNKLPLVEDISEMFSNCKNFNSAISFNSPNLLKMDGLFKNCEKLNKPIEIINTTKLTSLSEMFYGCEILNSPINIGFTYYVTDFKYMFRDCQKFNQSVSFLYTNNAISLEGMFYNCYEFNQLVSISTSNVKNISYMFYGCRKYNKSVGGYITSNVTTFKGMFSDCYEFNMSISFNTDKATDLSNMFSGCSEFNSNISFSDTSKVTNMASMFSFCSKFNNVNAPFTLDMSSVTDSSYMFSDCLEFNQIVNVMAPNLKNSSRMFKNCVKLNKDIKIQSPKLEQSFLMFENCELFNSNVEIDFVSIINCNSMFKNCFNFNKPIDLQNSYNLTNVSGIFSGCSKFDSRFNIYIGNLTSFNLFDSTKHIPNATNEDINPLHWDNFIKNIPNNNKCKILDNVKLTKIGYDYVLSKNILENFTKEILIQKPSKVESEYLGYKSFGVVNRLFNEYTNFVLSFDNNETYTKEFNKNNDIDNNITSLETNGTVYMWGKTYDFESTKFNTIGQNMYSQMAINTFFVGEVVRGGKFDNLRKVKTIDLSDNIRAYAKSVYTNSDNMFYQCYSLINIIGLETYFKSYELLSTKNMFNGCRSLNKVLDFKSENVIDMTSMFENCFEFNSNIQFNTSKVEIFKNFFYGCSKYNTPITFDTKNATNMDSMFKGCILFNLPLTMNTNKVTIFTDLLYGCKAFNESFSLNTSLGIDMSGLFRDCTSLNKPYSINIENAINISSMFSGCTKLNSKITFLNSSNKLLNISYLFERCSIFNQIVELDTSNVTTMNRMFSGCIFYNQPINLNTANCVSINYMFAGCSRFNRPINFNTSSMKEMSYVFLGCTLFNQVINFETSKVTNIRGLFQNCIALDGNITLSDTSNVISFIDTFNNTKLINLPNLNFSKTQNITNIIISSRNITKDSYDNLLKNLDETASNVNVKTLNTTNLKYSNIGKVYRDSLISKGWVITGDELQNNYNLLKNSQNNFPFTGSDRPTSRKVTKISQTEVEVEFLEHVVNGLSVYNSFPSNNFTDSNFITLGDSDSVLSMDVKTTSNGFKISYNKRIIPGHGELKTYSIDVPFTNNLYQRISIPFPKDLKERTTAYIFIYSNNNINVGDKITFKNIKFEKGILSTPYKGTEEEENNRNIDGVGE